MFGLNVGNVVENIEEVLKEEFLLCDGDDVFRRKN